MFSDTFIRGRGFVFLEFAIAFADGPTAFVDGPIFLEFAIAFVREPMFLEFSDELFKPIVDVVGVPNNPSKNPIYYVRLFFLRAVFFRLPPVFGKILVKSGILGVGGIILGGINGAVFI